MKFLNFTNKWQRRLFLIFFGFYLCWTSFRFSLPFVYACAFIVSYIIGLLSMNYFRTTINALIVLISMVFYYTTIGVVIGFASNGKFIGFEALISHLSNSFQFSAQTLLFAVLGFPVGQFSRWFLLKFNKSENSEQ